MLLVFLAAGALKLFNYMIGMFIHYRLMWSISSGHGSARSSFLCLYFLPAALGHAAEIRTQTIIGPDYRDTLKRAVSAPSTAQPFEGNAYDVFVSDQIAYDSNVYRLAPGVAASTVVGPNATKQDDINSASVGLDAHWELGKQTINVNARADDNLFKNNTDLNNVSGNGNLIWFWDLGSVLTGQVGTDYSRSLASFVNSNVYTRNMLGRTEYFASGRYQLGPRWTFFGGILDNETSLSANASNQNNSHSKSVDGGVQYATGLDNSIGLDYRYTNARYPNDFITNGIPFNQSYTESRTRFLFEYALSDKTFIDASAGYLKRDYPSSTIASFSGNVWRAALQWKPTNKTNLTLIGRRELQAYFTAQSDYFVSTSLNIASHWVASEKLTPTILLSVDDQKYIASGPEAPGVGLRHDRVTAQQTGIAYTPFRVLTLNLSFRHEHRGSNQSQAKYDDGLAAASFRLQF